jgi:prepilin-type N-terminal cleavage/methylation domain-containing protein
MKKLIFKKRHAFTMIELVFVIVMVGILSAILIPRMQGSRLYEAADQIASHIRYTQHLAMMDDKFDPTGGDSEWFKGRWQILFDQGGFTDRNWVYTIFSDHWWPTRSGMHMYSGTPEYDITYLASGGDEIAKNPQDTSKRLTGGSNEGLGYIPDNVITKALNLSKEYGIKKNNDGVTFNNCFANDDTTYAYHDASSTAPRVISFDYLGRPMLDRPSLYDKPYPSSISSYKGGLLTSLCTITLINDADEKIDIKIQPETGFVETSKIYY